MTPLTLNLPSDFLETHFSVETRVERKNLSTVFCTFHQFLSSVEISRRYNFLPSVERSVTLDRWYVSGIPPTYFLRSVAGSFVLDNVYFSAGILSLLFIVRSKKD